MTTHMIFYVNLDPEFTCKSRFIADGHKVDTSPLITYASVVSRDSVWIVLMPAAPNGLDMKFYNVQNAYLNSKPNESV